MSQTLTATPKTSLFSNITDTLLLGGGSVVVLLAIALFFRPIQNFYEPTLIVMLALSHFINGPHFAQSYMIFYKGFREKIAAGNLPLPLRLRYIVFGLVVPVILGGYFLYFALNPSAELLIFSIYAMAFFVGWHYVKQGYGMIILDTVLKRTFLTALEKKVLLVNAYVCWLSSYAFINTAPQFSTTMFGLNYQRLMLPYPDIAQYIATIAVLITTLPTLVILSEKIFSLKSKAPYCGIIAYLTSIYIWLFVAQMNPLFLLVIPAFHSLQYLAVVSRFVLNREKESQTDNQENGSSFLFFKTSPSQNALIRFYFTSVVIGFLGFWGLSYTFLPNYQAPTGLEGVDVFVIATTIFINIHHYFLDNVMWRKENNSVKKYLFQG